MEHGVSHVEISGVRDGFLFQIFITKALFIICGLVVRVPGY
jgi:hypothetical protein